MPSAGGRVLLWLKVDPKVALAETRIGTATRCCCGPASRNGERTRRAVVARMQQNRSRSPSTATIAEFLEQGAVNLDREAPEVTFTRGEQAIARFRSGRARQRPGAAARGAVRRARAELERALPRARSVLRRRARCDPARRRCTHALAAEDVALIHGPPGTGKTRTLVELVRQAVARGERVLVTAPSNTAVDNLGERLVEAGLAVVRLGHPARVSPGARGAHARRARRRERGARRAPARWIAEANAIRGASIASARATRLPWHRRASC